MAEGTTFVSVPTSGAPPEDYLVSGASSLGLLAAHAVYDGTSAAADFLPALQIVDQVGNVRATVFGSAVTAGDSREVTFAPFLDQPSSGSSGPFITSPQTEVFATTHPVLPTGNVNTFFTFTHASGQTLTTSGGGNFCAPLVDGVYSFIFSINNASGSSTAIAVGKFIYASISNAGVSYDMNLQGTGAGGFINDQRTAGSFARFLLAGASIQVSMFNSDTVTHAVTCAAAISRIG